MAKTRNPRKKKKSNKSLRSLLLVLAVAVVAFGILWFVDEEQARDLIGLPSRTASARQQAAAITDERAAVIAGLEIPLLTEGDELVIHAGFSLVYDEEHEQPKWVAYELTRDEIYGLFERADNFRADRSIGTGSASLDDYRNSGYDRGHLAPAADLSWSEQSLSDSFYLSNMSPQAPDFNRGIWASLEAAVRNFADAEGAVFVVTGPILTDGPYRSIGSNEVTVPKRYYKVILDYIPPELKAIGFILPNEGSNRSLQGFAVTVDQVEALSGIDFFPQLPDDQEELLESSLDTGAWDWKEFSASMAERQRYWDARLAQDRP